MKPFNTKTIDKIFEIGILLKSLFGIFEVLAGVIIATSGRLIINNLIIALTQQEISEDPKDFFANYIIKFSRSIYAGGNVFAVIYLIFHGVVNIFLAIFLLKGKIWAYPAAIGLFSAFLVYQVYRYIHTNSLLLLCLIVFDVFIVLFIWMEYRRKKSSMKSASI